MFISILAVFLSATLVRAASLPPRPRVNIIKNPQHGFSEGGNASCVSGLVDVPVVFDAQQWDIDVPTDQLSLTNFIFTYTTLGPDGFKNNGTKKISKTYEIWVKHCVPRFMASNSTVLQVLTHGGYSYVDAAASQGMATLNYDRLGIGRSEHPDPLLEVQGDAAIAVLHSLVGLVRAGSFGPQYTKVVGIGHSLGSKVTESIVSHHSGDFDAIALTGYAYQNSPKGGNANAPGYERAQDDPRFSHLPDGYVMSRYPEGIHLVFFKYPNFDPATGNVTVLESFTGPVMVLTGENDYSVCGFSCSGKGNPVEATLRNVFISANQEKSDARVLPGTGHNLNTHLNAAETYNHMIDWVRNV
ncbi:hypothetical protein LCI18_010644 [Fusarium solani-melongenae]|uniref:Uncharacterized protein n=1 Tax=Fusarium solani subsp. cucurbitae TaxID=2747967 RepID=A0ACD3ZEL7_FUSSC|nr:hypothetical protein LCI18_010644 [Fusarium solani-melongenae]